MCEALKNINFNGDLIVNLQGDAPLTPEWFVEDLIETFKKIQILKWPHPF